MRLKLRSLRRNRIPMTSVTPVIGLALRVARRPRSPGGRVSLLPRFVRPLALVLCGLAAFLLVGAGSASAFRKAEREEAEKYAERFAHEDAREIATEECGGTECHKTANAHLPAGDYLESINAGFSTFRRLERGTENCNRGGCEPYYHESPPKSTEWLAPGYTEIPVVIVDGICPDMGSMKKSKNGSLRGSRPSVVIGCGTGNVLA